MSEPGSHEPYQPAAPQPAPRARGGLPGWAIAAIIAGSLVSAVVAVASAAGLGALAWTVTSALAPPTASQQVAPPIPVDPTPDPGPSPAPDPASGEALAAHIVDMHESYLAALSDGSIYDEVPGGRNVDPDYIGAFVYSLADNRSAVRFMSVDQDAEELAALAEKTDELERRFLVGEDLGVEVEITRSDGTVFRSDGKYRTIDGEPDEPAE